MKQISVSNSILLSRLVSKSGKIKKIGGKGILGTGRFLFPILFYCPDLFLDRGRNLKNWKIGGKGVFGTGRFYFIICSLSRLVSKSGKKFKKLENRGKRSFWNRFLFPILFYCPDLFLDQGRN